MYVYDRISLVSWARVHIAPYSFVFNITRGSIHQQDHLLHSSTRNSSTQSSRLCSVVHNHCLSICPRLLLGQSVSPSQISPENPTCVIGRLTQLCCTEVNCGIRVYMLYTHRSAYRRRE